MWPGVGPQCRGHRHRLDKRSSPGSAETAEGGLRASHRARPTGTGGGPPEYRRRSPSWKDARFPRGSGKPYDAIGERGFPPLGYRSPAKPVRCGRGRAVLTAGKQSTAPGNRRHGRKKGATDRDSPYSALLTRNAGRAWDGLKDGGPYGLVCARPFDTRLKSCAMISVA